MKKKPKNIIAKAATMKTLTGIPIVGVGKYRISSGEVTFTEADLQDAVRAAMEDPSVRAPRLKVGHAQDGWQVGEPSLGTYTNLRLREDGQEIIADLETFDWLADILPVAYPNRSIEGKFGYTSDTGKKYRMVINAVAALGIELPGVSTLDDLREVLHDPDPELVSSMVITASEPGIQIVAQVDADDIHRKFYQEYAKGQNTALWIRSIRLNPDEVIAEDESNGNLYAIPFTTDNNQVEFGEAREVYVEYKDAPSDSQLAIATIFKAHSAARSRIIANETEEMVNRKKLIASLGLPSDATDEQIDKKVADLRAAAGEDDTTEDVKTSAEDTEVDESESTDEDDSEETSDSDDAASEDSTDSIAASTGVLVDPKALEELRRDAAMGRKAREEQILAQDQSIVDEAIHKGKFPPSSRNAYLKLLATDRKGTREHIQSLEDNVVPVKEVGRNDDIEATKEEDSNVYPISWLSPAEQARVAAIRKGAN